mgnify:CR=1 FL=1
MITKVEIKVCAARLNEGIAKSSMSVFNFPKYDVDERTGKLNNSHTTHALAKGVRSMNFDEIPDVIDVESVDITKP